MATTIRLTRSGGLAGLDMVASVDVDDLPAATGSTVRSALAGLGKQRAPAGTAGPPAGADRYQFDLVIDSDGKRQALTAHEGNLTPDLAAIVDALRPHLRPQGG